MEFHIGLTKSIETLQSSTLNCGGIWKVRRIIKKFSNEEIKEVLIKSIRENSKFDNIEKYNEIRKTGEWNSEESKQTKNLNLLKIENWESYLIEKINYWCEFELISKEDMLLEFNRDVFEKNKSDFIKNLKVELNAENDEIILYKVDENTFDTYDLWWHQIQEDFIFDLKDELIIINFGWSS